MPSPLDAITTRGQSVGCQLNNAKEKHGRNMGSLKECGRSTQRHRTTAVRIFRLKGGR